jgi:hypothetical protein
VVCRKICELFKQNLACQGKDRPRGIALIEEDLKQVEKTPEPLSHLYTRAIKSHVSAGLALRTVTVAGSSLNLCFGVWRGEGIFLTQVPKIHSKSNSGPRRCHPELLPLRYELFKYIWLFDHFMILSYSVYAGSILTELFKHISLFDHFIILLYSVYMLNLFLQLKLH